VVIAPTTPVELVYRTLLLLVVSPERVRLCPDATVNPPLALIKPVVVNAPEVLMVNCPVEPTESNCPGVVVPIPTLPLGRAVRAVVPPDMIFTLPVLAEPRFRVCALVVPNVPNPVR
jgi:hypothetical protein